MNVYISYGSEADQATALRLQALAGVNGIGAFVPTARTRWLGADTDAPRQIARADVVIALMTRTVSDACRQEVLDATTSGKPALILAHSAAANSLTRVENVIRVEELDPASAVASLEHALRLRAPDRFTDSLRALGVLAIGLLLLSAVEGHTE